MSKLTEESLEFAKKHISSFYDSDFFPKTFEFEAIWYNWEDVKKHLSSTNISKLRVKHPLSLASKKPKGSYRIVHQLEPLDTIIYTALAYEFAEAIELSRTPEKQKIACSYRIELSEGGFFSKDNGFKNFTERTEKLSTSYEYVLTTDITDFYNQIYLHRLNNALELAAPSLKNKADDLESFLTSLNDKSSQGIPVGPAASILMSEAILVDIDRFIFEKGVEHTRYVDDFRIFSDSKLELEKVLEELTLYLYEAHRLSLATDKTRILETEQYVEGTLHNQYELEKVEIFRTLEVLNPYSGEVDFVEVPVEDEDEKVEHQLNEISDQLLKRDTLDLGLARALIRKAKKSKNISIASVILDNFEFFVPVINDVVLYFEEVTNESFTKVHKKQLKSVINNDAAQSQIVRFWLEWYVAHNSLLLEDREFRQYIHGSEFIENQAIAAVTTKNVSWVRDIKKDVYNVGEKGKRAILFATQILPTDERTHWLKLFAKNSPEELDRWIAKWILEAK